MRGCRNTLHSGFMPSGARPCAVKREAARSELQGGFRCFTGGCLRSSLLQEGRFPFPSFAPAHPQHVFELVFSNFAPFSTAIPCEPSSSTARDGSFASPTFLRDTEGRIRLNFVHGCPLIKDLLWACGAGFWWDATRFSSKPSYFSESWCAITAGLANVQTFVEEFLLQKSAMTGSSFFWSRSIRY